MIDNKKSQIRAYYKTIRSSITHKSEKESIIVEKLKTFNAVKNADTVFAYAASGSEANIDPLIEYILSLGKTVALPVCSDKFGNMEFYSVESLEKIKVGMYSIREPESKGLQPIKSDRNSVCLVPAICFDKSGRRIGYGKGYYDRFLDDFHGCTIGVNFDECVTEQIPYDEYDKQVNYLITDKTIYKFISEEENTYG